MYPRANHRHMLSVLEIAQQHNKTKKDSQRYQPANQYDYHI